MALKLGNFDLENFKPSNLYTAYFGLSPREQTIALFVAAAVLVLVILLPVAVASNRISKLEKEAGDYRSQLRDILHVIENYNIKKSEFNQMQQTLASGFDATMPGTIESIADTSGVKDKIDQLKEKAGTTSDLFEEASVDVKLKKVTLEQLVNFLFAIEHNQDKFLRLKQLSIRPRYDNKQELDVTFTVSTYKLLEGAGEGT